MQHYQAFLPHNVFLISSKEVVTISLNRTVITFYLFKRPIRYIAMYIGKNHQLSIFIAHALWFTVNKMFYDL